MSFPPAHLAVQYMKRAAGTALGLRAPPSLPAYLRPNDARRRQQYYPPLTMQPHPSLNRAKPSPLYEGAWFDFKSIVGAWVMTIMKPFRRRNTAVDKLAQVNRRTTG